MKIVAINAVGLVGETPKGGWTVELKPEDSVHTLIAVHTDGGLIGYGSVFTNHLLVDAALKVLAPLWQGELALEPERVTEKLAQNSFWMGWAAALPTQSAASTSRCGTSWARRPVSRSGACSAAAAAAGCSPIARC